MENYETIMANAQFIAQHDVEGMSYAPTMDLISDDDFLIEMRRIGNEIALYITPRRYNEMRVYLDMLAGKYIITSAYETDKYLNEKILYESVQTTCGPIDLKGWLKEIIQKCEEHKFTENLDFRIIHR